MYLAGTTTQLHTRAASISTITKTIKVLRNYFDVRVKSSELATSHSQHSRPQLSPDNLPHHTPNLSTKQRCYFNKGVYTLRLSDHCAVSFASREPGLNEEG